MWQLWKEDSVCDEAALGRLMRELAAQIVQPCWVLLEGPMGAGKSTAARALIPEIGRAHV